MTSGLFPSLSTWLLRADYEFWGVCQRQAYQTMNAVHAISTVL
jgi:hypothetical protein